MLNTKKWKVEDKISFKKKLKDYCADIIREKVDEAIVSMQRAQEAANSEEKSSMGDKYETSKVMGQIDSDRAGLQLFESKKQLSHLSLVKAETIYKDVQPGAFIISDEMNYFVATSIGSKIIDGEKITILSAAAPLAMKMMGTKSGSEIEFNGKKIRIIEVF